MKIKTNDKVRIISGKDKGKEGKVIQVFPAEERLVVEGANMMSKHIRPRKGGEKGQKISLAGPMNVSNVMLLCPKCGKETRVGFKIEAGNKSRRCGQCQETID